MKWQSAIVKGFDLYINSTGSFGRKLWKFIDWKLLLPPVIMATVTSLLGVNTLMALDEAVLSKIMGTVLLVLAVYFIFFSSKVHLKAGLVSGLAAGAVSGFCGGRYR